MSLLELRVEAFAKLAISTGAEVVHLRLAMKGIHEQSFSLTASDGSPGRENLHQRLQFYKRNFAFVFRSLKVSPLLCKQVNYPVLLMFREIVSAFFTVAVENSLPQFPGRRRLSSCRRLRPSTRWKISSARFLAWSPARSRACATNSRVVLYSRRRSSPSRW